MGQIFPASPPHESLHPHKKHLLLATLYLKTIFISATVASSIMMMVILYHEHDSHMTTCTLPPLKKTSLYYNNNNVQTSGKCCFIPVLSEKKRVCVSFPLSFLKEGGRYNNRGGGLYDT